MIETIPIVMNGIEHFSMLEKVDLIRWSFTTIAIGLSTKVHHLETQLHHGKEDIFSPIHQGVLLKSRLPSVPRFKEDSLLIKR